MKKIIKVMTILCFSLLVTACATSPITGERISTLTPGDNLNKVVEVVGKPDGFDTLEDNVVVYKYINRYISGWDNKTTDYYLFFKNNKLVSIKNGMLRENSANLANALNSLNQQLDNQRQRENDSRMQIINNMNRNQPQKVIICKKGDFMCY